jgi:IS30 family transposase
MLYALKQEGCSMRRIAEHLSVHASTVYRETCRNLSGHGYRPSSAHRLAVGRRKVSRKPEKLTLSIRGLLSSYLKKRWSPEQISGRLKLDGILEISHETVYKYVRQDRDGGGRLHKFLRRQRKYRRHYGDIKRHRIANAISIDERPSVVNEKTRIGDWEADTIVPGNNKKAVLVTLVERVSKYLFIGKVDRRDSYSTANRIIDLLCKYKDKVLTITSDNGAEFSCHKIISNRLDAGFYFAHPYKSWERGLNENTNGLIRQYFPKKTSFENISYYRLIQVACNINDRPRKTLDYMTPREVFKGTGVALQS